MPGELKSKVFKGLIWSTIERFGQQGCSFLIQLLLARILAPEQFGLLAMVSVFIAISGTLIDAGFSQAIIQVKKLDDESCSTVFYFNIFAALLGSLTLYFSSPLIASFYREPELVDILSVLSLSLLVGAYGRIHYARLTRDMRFEKLLWVTMPATLLAGASAIAAAMCGLGVWALVVNMLVMTTGQSVLLRIFSGWAPTQQFSFSKLRAMFPYAWRLAAVRVVDTVFDNIYVLVIGRSFSAAQTGYFERARAFQKLPSKNMVNIMGRVIFPMFSRLQDQPDKLRYALKRAVQLACLCAFPLMALLAAVAEPLIEFLIGPQWLPSVNYFRLLVVGAMMMPLSSVNMNLLKAMGRSDAFLKLAIIKYALALVNVVITCQIGVMAMVIGIAVLGVFSGVINTFYAGRWLGFGVIGQMRAVLRPAIIGAAVFAAASLTLFLVDGQAGVQLAAGVCAGAVTALAGLRILSRELRQEISKLCRGIPGLGLVSRLLF